MHNKNCISGADYKSIYCSLNRKYKMPGDNEDSLALMSFATMQKQIDEKNKKIARLEEEKEKGEWIEENKQKDKRIKELEEQVKTLDEAYTGTIQESKKWFDIAHNSIPTQVVIDKIEEIKKDKDSKYYDKFLCERDIENVIEILQELLEGERK